MDVRTDTSSGRFGGQWAYLNNQIHYGHSHSRSLPPSSYLPRSDPSNVSAAPALPPLYHFNNSRTSLLLRTTRPASSINGVGHPSSVTLPSQPVLVREHSAEASAHSRPGIRSPPRRLRESTMNGNDNGNTDLPPLSAFSLQGILEVIQEDIDPDIDAISEILGRSRLTLADQHDSHLPPQGEIRARGPLQAVEEASASMERLAGDNILIVNDDFSLVDGGSNVGSSAAYGLLERLQAVPRTRRRRSEVLVSAPIPGPSSYSNTYTTFPSPRTQSSPAMLPDPNTTADYALAESRRRSSRASCLLLSSVSGPSTGSRHATTTPASGPVVSETYLSAGAHGRTVSDPPVVSEAGRHYPLYSYDESEIFKSTAEPDAEPGQPKFNFGRAFGLIAWLNVQRREEEKEKQEKERSAEARLRGILLRESGEESTAGLGIGIGIRGEGRGRATDGYLEEDVVPDTVDGEMYD